MWARPSATGVTVGNQPTTGPLRRQAERVRMAKVLVVEDDPDIRMLLDARLQNMGHEVVAVAGSSDALALVGLYGLPDLMVLDIVMEGIDGLSMLNILRRVADADLLPAIVMTARQLPEDHRAVAELNATLLLKPVVAADLSRAVDRALAFTGEPVGWSVVTGAHGPAAGIDHLPEQITCRDGLLPSPVR